MNEGLKAYSQQARLHPDWATRPALTSRAAHAVESKAVFRIEVVLSPRPCLGCAVELVLRVAPLGVLLFVNFVGGHGVALIRAPTAHVYCGCTINGK